MKCSHRCKGFLLTLFLLALLRIDSTAARAQGLLVHSPSHRAPHGVISRDLSTAETTKSPSFAAFLRTHPAPEPSVTSDAKTTAFMQKTIRQAYDSLARYTKPSGKEISFYLNDFRTYDQTEFDFVRWLDLVTMPGGDLINVESRTHQDSSNPTAGRTEYVPHWKRAPEYIKSAQGQLISDYTVTRVFQAALADEPRLAAVTKLTSYEVTVWLEGQSRKYRAAFLWIEDRDGTTMLPYDYITGLVGQALVEKFPPGRTLSPRQRRSADKQGMTKSICYSGYITDRSWGLFQQDTTGHSSGYHAVDGAWSASCYCHEDCSQDCESNGFGGCDEWGDVSTFYCHQISNPGFSSVNGHANPGGTATCSAMAACAWRECFACLCGGISISVSYNGAGFSIGTGPAGLATLQKGDSFPCPPCQTQPTCNNNGICEPARGESEQNCPNDCYVPPDPCNYDGWCDSYYGEDEYNCPSDCYSGGGGGGDDGGGGGMCDEGSWVTEWECEYICGGWSDGEYCWVNAT
jgi:hypothetical protein